MIRPKISYVLSSVFEDVPFESKIHEKFKDDAYGPSSKAGNGEGSASNSKTSSPSVRYNPPGSGPTAGMSWY